MTCKNSVCDYRNYNLDNCHFERLSKSIEIYVSNEHKFGTDAFLLSDFAAHRRRDRVCDLGTGCGIIPLLMFRYPENTPKEAWGVDIQPKAIEQLKITVETNNIGDKFFPVCADLKDLSGKVPFDCFDVVTCNPPYKAAGQGILNEADAHTIARHEVMCNIDDVCKAASKLLKFGGRLCICQRPERLLDVMQAMRDNKIEPKRIRMVHQRPDEAPWLVLIEGKKGSKPFLKVEKPFLIERIENREFSDELLNIYGGEYSALSDREV